MLIDHCFQLENGEYVFVEMEDNIPFAEVREFLEEHAASPIGEYLGVYSVEEAEELGYDTF